MPLADGRLDGLMDLEPSTLTMVVGLPTVVEIGRLRGIQAQRLLRMECQMGLQQALRLLDMVEAILGALRPQRINNQLQLITTVGDQVNHLPMVGARIHTTPRRPVHMSQLQLLQL